MSTNPCAVRGSSSACHVFNQAAITDRNSDTTAGGGFRRPLAVRAPLTLRAGVRVRF